MVSPRALLAACLLAGGLGAPAAAEAPGRVVSINLCTDQLAMMLAAPGQLVSVTEFATDPSASVMAEAAKAYPANGGRAEEVYLLHPDLVLAGQYTARVTVSMLRRLGVPVVEFGPGESLDDVRANILRMGEVLGRESAAQALAQRFDSALAALEPPPGQRPTAATYAVNGYTTGDRSLSGAIIARAGFDNLAQRFGLPYGGILPLEALVISDPDLVISGQDYPGPARAEEVLHHPAFLALEGDHAVMQDRDWVCGLPSVVGAIERLTAQRHTIEAKP